MGTEGATVSETTSRKGGLFLRRVEQKPEKDVEVGAPKKFRCPYCQETAEWKDNKCPSCGKISRPPDYYAKKLSKPATRREERERRRREMYQGAGAGGMLGAFVAKSPLMRWMLLLGGLAVVGSMIYTPHQKKDYSGGIKQAQYNLSILRIALDTFHDDCGRFPTTREGLAALIHNPQVAGWHGPYIRKLKPDPWRRPFVYASDGSDVVLLAKGPDGVEGTKDDVTIIEAEDEEVQEILTVEDATVSIGGNKTTEPLQGETAREKPTESEKPAEDAVVNPR